MLAVSIALFVALLSMRLAHRVSLPYAGLILVAAALIAASSDSLQTALSVGDVQNIAVVALIVILFEGGLHIGAARFRRSLRPILALGVVGTFVTAGLVALAARYLLGFSWIEAGWLRVHIDRTLPLGEASAAHAALESRRTVGKVLLVP